MTITDLDTEQKIKAAASQIFQERGFAGTTTRDIAKAANVNLALVNYYFRSKRKLFNIVMTDILKAFFEDVLHILHDPKTTLKEKISHYVNAYMDLLTMNPNIATFVMNSVRENPDDYIKHFGFADKISGSSLMQQLQDGIVKGELPPLNPLHFLLNLMGLVAFPFIAQPMICAATNLPKELFFDMIQERRKYIPLWIDAMLIVH